MNPYYVAQETSWKYQRLGLEWRVGRRLPTGDQVICRTSMFYQADIVTGALNVAANRRLAESTDSTEIAEIADAVSTASR